MLWDTNSGELVKTLAGAGVMSGCLAFSPTGTSITYDWGHDAIRIWDLKADREQATLRVNARQLNRSVAYSADGTRLASGGTDQVVRLWDAHDGAELATFKGHSKAVTTVAFCPDGKVLASAGLDGTIILWDLKSTAAFCSCSEAGHQVHRLTISPDSSQLAAIHRPTRFDGSQTSDAITIWDADSGDELVEIRLAGSYSDLPSMVFSPVGERIVAASKRDEIKLWSATSGVELATTGVNSAVNGLAFSPDGKRVVSACADSTARVWDALHLTEIAVLKGHRGAVQVVAFSPNGLQLATGSADKTIKLWDAASNIEVATLNGRTEVLALKFSPDGNWIASGGQNGTITLWDMRSAAETATLKGHRYSVESVAFSPDGKRIVSSGRDETVRIWDFDQHTELVRLNDCSGVAFASNGRRLFTSRGRSVQMFDAHDVSRTERTARFRVNRLFDELVLGPGVIDAIMQTPGLSEQVRDAMLRCARSRVDSPVSRAFRYTRLANEHLGHRRLADAQTAHLKAIDILGELVRSTPDVTSYRAKLAAAYVQLGLVQRERGELTEAGISYKAAVNLCKSVAARDIPDLTNALENLVNGIVEAPKRPEVSDDRQVSYKQAIEIQETIIRELGPSDDREKTYVSLLVAAGRFDEAEAAIQQTIDALSSTVEENPQDVEKRKTLALKYVDLADARHNAGRHDDAQQLFEESIRALQKLADEFPDRSLSVDLAFLYNNISWKMATFADARLRNPRRAVELAQKAVELAPQDRNIANTMGIAQYYSGNWRESLAWLEKSSRLSSGGDSFDWFFQAMAHYQLGDKDEAGKWYDKSVEWMEKNQPSDEDLVRFRAEAEQLLGITPPNPAAKDASAADAQRQKS